MKKILFVIIALILIFNFISCGNEKYTVIKKVEYEGMTMRFEYSQDGKKVTVSVDEYPDAKTIMTVNEAGAIVSIYNSGEEITIDNPNVTEHYNGYIQTINYNKMSVTFDYDFESSKVNSIKFIEKNGNSHTYNRKNYDDCSKISYSGTKHRSFRMFNSVVWFFSMSDALDAVYGNY